MESKDSCGGDRLLHRARCPVLTVPRPRVAAGEQDFWGEEAVATR